MPPNSSSGIQALVRYAPVECWLDLVTLTVKTENWSQMICTIDSQTRPFVYTRNTQTRRAFPK